MKTENLSTLKIHKLTQAQYDRELAAGNIDENAIYLTPDYGSSGGEVSPELINRVDTLGSNVASLQTSVNTNTENINTNTEAIALNKKSIEDNKTEADGKIATVEQSLVTQGNEIEVVKGDLTSHATSSNSQFALVREEFADADAETLKSAKDYSDANKNSAIGEAKAYTNQEIEKLVTDTEFEGVLSTIQDIQNAMATDEELAQALETANGKKVDKGAKGSATQPIYFDDNGAQPIAYTIEKSVPADAKFTDTTYTLIKDATNKKIQLMNGDKLVSEVDDNNTTYTIDGSLSTSSTNPVQNKVISENLNNLWAEVGKNTDSIEEINSKDLFETKYEEGNAIAVSDSAEVSFAGMKLYGKTTQNDTPTPDAPVPLISVGDSGSFEVEVYGKNLWNNANAILNSASFTKTDTGFIFNRELLTGGTYVSFKTPLHKGQTITFSAQGSNYAPNVYIYKEKIYGTIIARDQGSLVYTAIEDLPNATFAIIINSDEGSNEVSNIQIEIGTTATPYEPYKAKQTLTFTDTLRGIGDIKDEKDFARGVTTQRFKEVEFDGSDDEPWSTLGMIDSGLYRYHVVVNGLKPDYASAICSHFKRTIQPVFGKVDEVSFSAHPTAAEIHFFDEHTTLDEFKAWLAENPIKVVYRLETPIETPLTEEELNAYRQLHTNKPNTTVLSEADMEIDYVVNSTSAEYIENRLDTLKSDIDKISSGGSSLATVAITGEYNDLNNKPTIPTKTSQLTNDSSFVNQTGLNNALEDKLSFDEEVVNSTTDVTKIVPEGSGKYAAVNKVGGMSYKSRNLLEITATTQTKNGVTFTVNADKSITISGTATDRASFSLTNTIANTFTNYILYGCPNGSADTYYFYIDYYKQDGTWATFVDGAYGAGTRLTVNQPKCWFNLVVVKGATVNATVYPMILEATETNTSYEPYYSGLRNSYVNKITATGKNLLNINRSSTVSGGITITVNTDKSITYEGTATTGFSYAFCASSYYIPKGSYKMLGTGWSMELIKPNNTVVNYNAGASFEIVENGCKIYPYRWFAKGITYEKNTIYPMLVRAENTDLTDYEPYKEDTFTIPTGARGVGYGMGINESCYNYIDFERKVYIQNCVKVNLGSLDWRTNQANRFLTDSLTLPAKPFGVHIIGEGLCDIYSIDTWNNINNGVNDKTIAAHTNSVYVCDLNYTDLESFKTAMTGVYLIYPLATPIETDISDYIQDNFIEVAAGGLVTAVNEYNYNVPTEYEFFTSENPEKVIVADKIVGDFVGTFMGELTTSGTVAATSFKIGEGCNLVYDTTNKCVSFQFL